MTLRRLGAKMADPIRAGMPMPLERKGFAELLREIAMVVLGLVLAVVPLALWLAWSETAFYSVLAVGAVAMVLILALISFGPEDDRPTRTKIVSAPELIAEVHRLIPLTHHHRRLNDPRIRRKMARVRALMRRPGA